MYELNHDLKLFSRFDKLFKSDLSKRYRFLIFFGIRKIFLDFPFSASVIGSEIIVFFSIGSLN